MRIALVQCNPVVGDIAGNTASLRAAIAAADADLVITPELAICGYPPRDLLLQSGFVEACEGAVESLATAAPDTCVLVGYPRRDAATGRLRNSVAILRGGVLEASCDKRLLPGYDVFDEDRYFEPADLSCLVDVAGTRVGIAICEDFWRAGDAGGGDRYGEDPLGELAAAGATLVAVPSASPFVVAKRDRHISLAIEAAAEYGVTIAMCNQVGANDDLVFDGGSFVASGDGLLGQLPCFEEAIASIDTDATPTQPADSNADAERFSALQLGLRDYCHKSGHGRVLLGLSGGIDSALVATIATAALGPEAVTGVLMPSRHSSRGSIEDAELLVANLGLTDAITLPIERLHAAFEETMAEGLQEVSAITDENAQARARGMLLMGMANERSALTLVTGNKSELAMGYCTLYGDMNGAVAVIADVLKTDCWSMARWINAHHAEAGFDVPPIPEASITKPPSAELRPNQCDQDTLPPYETLDAIIKAHVEEDLGPLEAAEATGLDIDLVEEIVTSVDRAQFKRDQSAVILKVSARTFGRGRPMPIIMRRSGAAMPAQAGADE